MALQSGARWTGGTVGYIGLGHMGQPMVAHLLASGVPVLAYDLVADHLAAMTARGAQAARSVADMTSRCDVVVLSLPDPAAVENVVGQLLAAPKKGVTIVDLSTSDPALSQALGKKAKAAGMQFVDAPVSGGPVRSLNGTLTIMIGGEDAAVQAALPVLNVLGGHVVHIGGPGMGDVVKLVNNMVMLSNQLIVSEAILLAEKAGVPARQMVEIMSTGSARSYALERTAPNILSGDFTPGMTLTLALKDVALANQLGRSVGQPLRVAAVTEKLLRQALEIGLADYDTSGVYEAAKRTS